MNGDLIQQYEVSLSRMFNDILILDQQWLSNQSDFPPITWPSYRAWPSPIPWSICNGCGMPAGNAYPSGHLVPSPIVGHACAPIFETRFLELAMSLLDFSPRILLGTFSILPCPVYTSCFIWTLHNALLVIKNTRVALNSFLDYSIHKRDWCDIVTTSRLRHNVWYKIDSWKSIDERFCLKLVHTY